MNVRPFARKLVAALAAFGLTRNMRAVRRARLLGVADEH